jgi:phage replication O-like protein O
MADENGKELKNYTRIYNPILEAICKARYLNASDIRVVFCIIRSTYGWHKTNDPISKSMIAEQTELSARAVIKSIKKLKKLNIIIEYGTDKHSRCKVLGINKKINQWNREGEQLDTEQSFSDIVNNRSVTGGTTVQYMGEQLDTDEGEQSFRHKRYVKDNLKTDLKKEKKKKKNFFSPDGYLIKELDDEYGYYHDKDGNVCRAERKKLIQKEVDA